MSPFQIKKWQSRGIAASCILLISLLFSSSGFAADARSDYDLDDDGLIEINDVSDLREIRNNVNGGALYGSSDGCPAEGCIGFELTADLDFDVDGSGEIEDDEKWRYIGSSSDPFTATFDGNFHRINNLTGSPFFLYLEDAVVHSVIIDNAKVTGLAGFAYASYRSSFSDIVFRGDVEANHNNDVAGFIRKVWDNSSINRVYFEGSVRGYNYVGGLVATLQQSIIENSLVAGDIYGRTNQGFGGLVATGWDVRNSYSIATQHMSFGKQKYGLHKAGASENSYWDVWATTATQSASGLGLTTEEMICPTNSYNMTCAAGKTIYENWDSAHWDFGTATQYPGLKIGGKVYRPMLKDDDKDTIANIWDAFPNFEGASLDADGDSIPDECHQGFDLQCEERFGVVKDNLLNDSDNDGIANSQETDKDGDGVEDSLDAFPQDATETVDTDLDGIGDVKDRDDDGNGLIEIASIQDLELLYQLNTEYVEYEGCISLQCIGFELVADIDFDSNGNGSFDELDSHWNEGRGWTGIQIDDDNKLVLEGNNHHITNFYSDQTGINGGRAALFSNIRYGKISQFSIDGVVKGDFAALLVASSRGVTISEIIASGKVEAQSSGGGIVSQATYGTKIEQSSFTGEVDSAGYAGGIAGVLESSTVRNSVASGSIKNAIFFGGLAGRLKSRGLIENSYSTMSMHNYGLVSAAGGILGQIEDVPEGHTYLINSYWDTNNSLYAGEGQGFTTPQLICPKSSTDTSCAPGYVLYDGWDSAIWSFADAQQYPALILASGLVRPAIMNADGDSTADYLDDFPNNPDASIDEDQDGLPDVQWEAGCDASCQLASDLVFDQHFNDTDNDGMTNDVDSDIDNDGIANGSDRFPLDASESTDLDGDGVGDHADVDDDNDGLVDVATLRELQAIITFIDPEQEDAFPVLGCANNACVGFELTQDLDFDENGDGVFDDQDSFWNDGLGWIPIGTSTHKFNRIFEGNNYTISNLLVNNSELQFVGLFGYAENGEIRNIKVIGKVNGEGSYNKYAGLIAGYGWRLKIKNAIAIGSVYGSRAAGGITSGGAYIDIENSFADVHVSGGSYVGGLMGLGQQGFIKNSMSVGVVESAGSYVGGLVGVTSSTRLESSLSLVSNLSYTRGSLAQRALGHLWGNGSLPEEKIVSSYWMSGLSLTEINEKAFTQSELKCPTIPSDTGCASLTLFEGWDPLVWDFGASNQLPGLVINGVTYRADTIIDTDGDYYPDAIDAFDNIAAVALDSDGDGYPDAWTPDCDAACQTEFGFVIDQAPFDTTDFIDTDNDGLGNASDLDDDNDGIADVDDAFSLIAIGTYTDTDGDGAPDNCEGGCSSTGMTADEDDDNDGVADIHDYYQLDASEWANADGDSLGDNADPDDDNDGVDDELDPELGPDNGLPIITQVPAEMAVGVTTDNGYSAHILMDADFLSQITATDVADGSISNIQGWWQNNPLIIDDQDRVELPAGRQSIEWIAIDDAGNQSEAVEQIINVYPQLRFDKQTSIVGEATVAQIQVRLTGDSPVYPVVVNVQINGLSEADQDDLDAAFDTSIIHQLSINAGDDEFALNRTVLLNIPTVQDDVTENDEQLLVDVLGVGVAEGEDNYFSVATEYQQHTLTITQQNLAPTVRFTLEQNGLEVANVVQDAGQVTLAAVVTDGNGSDSHSYIWDIGDLSLSPPLGSDLSFDPSTLMVGTYPISLLVTDSGVGNLTAQIDTILDVVASPEKEGEVNVAPVLELKLKQNGVEVAEIKTTGGLVSITATITDGNAADSHTLSWDLASLNLSAPNSAELIFDPTNLVHQSYIITVRATDDGEGQLNSAYTLSLRVVAGDDNNTSTPRDGDDSGSSNGGALGWLLLFLAGAVLTRRGRFNQLS